ncbi:MAG TPA: hypothetical protein PLJ08_11285, partial [Cyclobacteriaceae bacterium]|nr:hypothetical protein [Cyclobacteriaceae bacterium]
MSKKKFKEKKAKRDKKERSSLYSSLIQFLEESNGKAYSVEQLIRKFGLKKKSLIEDLFKLLDVMVDDGTVEQLSNGHFKITKTAGKLTGIVDHVNPRFAYVTTGEEGKKDIYIRTNDLATAIHGDTV